MSAPAWTEIKRIFDGALGLPLHEQQSFVRSASEHEGVRAEVESLLRAHQQQPAGFLEEPVAGPSVPPPRVGIYRMLHEIGHGGMGVVWLAGRDDGSFEQRVAVKLVRSCVRSEVLIRRFEIERRILSILEHPSITRLLDAGTASDGVPYLVMEYVDGEPIDRYCDRRALADRERLALFLDVCDAVAFAHRKLIVHRDLKPANILVTADGAPKLLDFGVAKLLEADGAGAMTATDLQMLTPRYASPEQLRGEAVSTASDVYSLGVILHELLTGVHPFEAATRSSHELVRAILEQEPSLRRATATSGTSGAAIGRRLSGDLEVIILSALRREPEARYASVADLASDVRRYLEGWPILARKPTVVYKVRKFVTRNKLGVAAATLACVALVGGTVVATSQAVIARRERERAEQQEALATARYRSLRDVSSSFMLDLITTLEPVPGSLPARQVIARRALAQLDELHRSAPGDPELAADVAAAYERVSQCVADVHEVERIRRLAVSMNEALVAAHPLNRRYRRQLASSLCWLGNVLKLAGAHDREVATYERAGAILATLVKEEPRDVATHELLRDSLLDLGRAYANQGRFEAAVEAHARGLEVARALAARFPGDERRRGLALAQCMLGRTLIKANRWDEALEHHREALPVVLDLAARFPADNRYRRDVWLVRRNLGRILAHRGDSKGALSHLHEALALKLALYRADPEDRGHQRGLAVTHLAIGEALEIAGRNDEALAAYEKAIDIGDDLLLTDPAVAETYADLQNEYGATRALLERLGRVADADALVRRERGLYEKVLLHDPANPKALGARARLRGDRGSPPPDNPSSSVVRVARRAAAGE